MTGANKSKMRTFPLEAIGRGTNNGKFAGAFPPTIDRTVRGIVGTPCLHLFSGASTIGDVRVDLEHPNATHRMNVFEFLKSSEAQKEWETVLLDPPYGIVSSKQKLKQYADRTAVSSSVPKRRTLAAFFLQYARNVVWFDQCAPLPEGFYRAKVWLVLPGGYRTVRILSWLRRNELRPFGSEA